MSDFAQSGLISTLQRLNDAHTAQIEKELGALSLEYPIALVLPCHARDLESPAFTHILEELRGAKFITEIVVSMNGISRQEFQQRFDDRLFAKLPPHAFLFNESAGKGGNVRAAIAHLVNESASEIIVTQDCDVASFRRGDLARLCYAIANPQLGYRFAKMYYSRVTDRLYGRVSRLFLTPLLHALVRVAGHQPLLDFLASFRYSLAGEVAMARELAASLPVCDGYGLEIGQLCEVFRRVDPRDVCQVGGGSDYDHRHQPATTALAAMAGEIARELLRQCAIEGLPSDAAFRTAIASAYRREAGHALRRSAHLALINGLPFDEDAEAGTVAAFAAQLD